MGRWSAYNMHKSSNIHDSINRSAASLKKVLRHIADYLRMSYIIFLTHLLITIFVRYRQSLLIDQA